MTDLLNSLPAGSVVFVPDGEPRGDWGVGDWLMHKPDGHFYKAEIAGWTKQQIYRRIDIPAPKVEKTLQEKCFEFRAKTPSLGETWSEVLDGFADIAEHIGEQQIADRRRLDAIELLLSGEGKQ